MKEITIRVPGMQNAEGQSRVSKAVMAIEGVAVQHRAAGAVSLYYSNNADGIIKAIEQAGYGILPE